MVRDNPKSRKNMQPKSMRMSVLSRKIAENRNKIKDVLVKLVLLEQAVLNIQNELHPKAEENEEKTEENTDSEEKEETEPETEQAPEQEVSESPKNE